MPSAAEIKQERVDRLMGLVLATIPQERHRIAVPLIRQSVEDFTLDDLRNAEPGRIAGVITSLLDWIATRSPGATEISIFNPQDDGQTWAEDHTVIQILTTDSSFLVDSLTGELHSRDLSIRVALHPQINARRDPQGHLLEILPNDAQGEGVGRESVMLFQIDRLATLPERVALETRLHQILADVRTAVADWSVMVAACKIARTELEANHPAKSTTELEETLILLEWLANDHFLFLGVVMSHLEVKEGKEYLCPDTKTGLGLLRKLPLKIRASSEQPLPPDALRFLHSPQLIAISKASSRSTVHRTEHMDVISLKRFGSQGEVIGEIHFVGLFTSMAYIIPVHEIPLVRRKVQRVVERKGFLPASHDAKALRHILEDYPREELFQISEKDLLDFASRILELQLRPRLALLVRRDEEERFISCMVYVPRERLNSVVQQDMRRILEESFGGVVTASHSRTSDRPLARAQYVIKTTPGQIPEYNVETIEGRLTEAVKTWEDRLKDQLVLHRGDEAGRHSFRLFAHAFPPSYQQFVQPSEALKDIPLVDAALASNELALRVYQRESAAEDRLHVRTFRVGICQPLSDILPRFENMGLKVLSENPFEVRPLGSSLPVWVRDFEVVATGGRLDNQEAEVRFKDAFRRLYRGEVDNDGFNRLVLAADLTWRQVVVLRAYYKYVRQISVASSQAYTEQTLTRYGKVAHGLIELFEQRFDPERQNDDRSVAILAKINAELEHVKSLDEDRILRRFLNLIQSTLRTNYYQRDVSGHAKTYLSFKLDSAQVLELPKPRPLFEVFVYSTRVEAVHLRGGKVARGGIRWSDRLEDFRTEILGLVKSQMVKNAVIVPVGAKGGFIVKKPPVGDRDAFQKEGIECYKTLIRGLLDLTDNLQGEGIVYPPDVVRRDVEDDPYLVVAADKGTATFSDIANGVAAEYGFWLGDAFASGGSLGYDHKKMAITARGAWESVKRHFRELGKDCQTETFSCVGVGDMAGDVFGNGLLQSEKTLLYGAFNHLHIFVDPNPDPAVSFAERQRMFNLPRSSWLDYDRSKMSTGGDIFERSAKKLTISKEVKDRFGLDSATLTPADLMRALLKADVDLLFFGGIGTFVKATSESHPEVGDRANDELRIDGLEVRAKVIGEGANLGMTQRGRSEFALAGGRLNTDFIDNSGGVDCSDHEVNIKIGLRTLVEKGQLDAEARKNLLVEMTDEVARLVLRDNYLQSQAISLVELQKATLLDEQAELMRDLEAADRLDRRLERLPSDAELVDRRKSGKGLTRPEIAVILAHSKIATYNDLIDSDLPDDEALLEDLLRYFPKAMQERHRGAILSHRLRREIIGTHTANSLVNRVGPTFVTRIKDQTNRSTEDIARAYIAARDVFGLRSFWDEVEALDNKVEAEQLLQALLDANALIASVTGWFLRHGGRGAEVAACRRRYEKDIVTVAAQLEEMLPQEAKKRVRRRTRRLTDEGLPEVLAEQVARMLFMASACDVAQCAQASGVEVDHVGRLYFQIGERFGFDRLRRSAEIHGADGIYQKAALRALIDDLATHQSRLTTRILEEEKGRAARPAINAWIEKREAEVTRYDRMGDDFEAAQHVDLAMLAMAERTLRALVG